MLSRPAQKIKILIKQNEAFWNVEFITFIWKRLHLHIYYSIKNGSICCSFKKQQQPSVPEQLIVTDNAKLQIVMKYGKMHIEFATNRRMSFKNQNKSIIPLILDCLFYLFAISFTFSISSSCWWRPFSSPQKAVKALHKLRQPSSESTQSQSK